ncbi:MAG: FHA domain-containing protein, partial [Demequinaceae bacterium]|nr:FHA domain-containing protein [Demequinaceae bacterium]
MSLRLSFTRWDNTATMVSVAAPPEATVGAVAEHLFRSDPARSGLPVPQEPTLVVTPRSLGANAPSRSVDPTIDVASSGIRSGDHVAVVPTGDAQGVDVGGALATVTVLEGADKGKTFPLSAGSHVIGRDAEVSVRLADPLASKRHARIIVGDSIEVVDTGSTNGVMLGDTYITRATLLPGDRIAIGDTQLEIARAVNVVRTIPTTPTVPYTRSPRVVPPLPDDEISLPDPPSKPQARSFPRIALVAPVVMGLSMYLITGRLMSLVFVVMSPMMIVGGFFDNRFTQRKQSAAKLEEFRADLTVAEEQLLTAQDKERQTRVARSPSIAEVCTAIAETAPPLWTHRAEHEQFLEVRLGLGTVPSSLKVALPAARDAVEGTWPEVQALHERFARISGVPVTASLRSSGGLGIIGSGDAGAGVARAAIMQTVGLHSPMECVLTAFVPPAAAESWSWLEWLPHASSPVSPIGVDHVVATRGGSQRLLTALEELVATRSGKDIGSLVPKARGTLRTAEGEPEAPTTPAIVVVVQDDAPADRRRLIRLAEKGPDVSVHVMWIAKTSTSLPAACRSYVDASTGTSGAVGHVRRGGLDEPVEFETLSVEEATDAARRLACVEDIGVVVDDTADVPSAVSYLELHGFDALEPGHTEQRWRRDATVEPGVKRPFSLRALVGHAGDEPFYLDLKAQGPHALVGGTTGAGKSEFLQSWILGLAAAYSPERVTFLYVDYKGGSAFADCVQLPHTVGLVTDLTPHLVDRALTSLRAELHYRERLLAAKGAKDLETLV